MLWAGCRKNDVPAPRLYTIVIEDIVADVQNVLPAEIAFDRLSVEVSGFDWQTVATIEASFRNDTARLILPETFPAADLQRVDRGANGRSMEGHWPSISDDPDARVATLREEIVVWQGDRRIGRIYLTDWPGTGSTVGKMYLNFQYADRPFVLDGFTGSKSSFQFNNCPFVKGWNTYAKVNASTESIRITTRIPENAKLIWRFEQWP